MAAKKPCFRCSRKIDDWARICPFCNADQSSRAVEAAPEHEVASIELPTRRKTTPNDFFRTVPGRVVIGLGILALLGGTFAIGTVVYSLGSASDTAGTSPDQGAPPPPGAVTRAVDGAPGGLTLVPSGGAVTSFEQSAPQEQPATGTTGEPPESMRRDATALSAEVYARMAQAERLMQQRREQELRKQAADPRSIEAPPAWAAGQRRPTQPAPQQPPTTTLPQSATKTPPQPEPREPQPRDDDEARAARRTPPIPISQPIPSADSISGSGTVRLNLTVDAAGRVREVEIVQSAPGITAQLISSVRRWRFRPATEGGQPVEGIFPVEVSFNAGND